MTLAASNSFLNFSAAFTPSSGASTPRNIPTDIEIDGSSVTEMLKGGFDRFQRIVATPTLNRTIKLSFADTAGMIAIPQGSSGSLAIIIGDGNNAQAVGGGGITLTLSPCRKTDMNSKGTHAKFFDNSETYVGYAADGATDPLTSAAL